MPKERLKKELTLFHVYAIATGTTLSAGFFLLPGLAAEAVGPGIVLAYMLAVVPLIPAVFSIVELATAMPRAGGVYYFLDRALGPLVGLIGGMGTWLALILKVAFALVGMGAYISLFVPGLSLTPVAVSLAVAIGILNIFGAKKSGRLQIFLVIGLLILLTGFILTGVPRIDPSHFRTVFDSGFSSLLSTAGLVYISYVGVTNIASLSEEVQDPERNLPLGVFLALGTSIVIYGIGTAVMVGVIPLEELTGDLTPAATAAGYIFGEWGVILVSIAAILAFISVANAGTLSASRYPLAMSRDHLIPSFINRFSKFGTPVYSILITVTSIVLLLVLFDPTGIAKLASAFQLLMFALVCLAVIIMRESRIESYDPGYKAPLYPWMQIAGIVFPIIIIGEMGWLSVLFSLGLIVVGIVWYWKYAKDRVVRNGAIYHIFERLGRSRFEGLDRELREILKEKGLRDADPFEVIISRSHVIDLPDSMSFQDLVPMVADRLSERLPHTSEEISDLLMKGTQTGATPVTHGVALPHFRSDGIDLATMVIVRAREDVQITFINMLSTETETAAVKAVFFLVSPEDDPGQHLRILAQIARRVEDEDFASSWETAPDIHAIKDVLLRHDRYLILPVRHDLASSSMIGTRIADIQIPDTCLISWIRRNWQVIVPRGNTVIQPGDELTIIGDPQDLQILSQSYSSSTIEENSETGN
ncbi:MAG: amino acid permease [Candidatus Latescibacteria bacterium]|nr:amino acid permease [Candidatus Latescibacterota bacterium]